LSPLRFLLSLFLFIHFSLLFHLLHLGRLLFQIFYILLPPLRLEHRGGRYLLRNARLSSVRTPKIESRFVMDCSAQYSVRPICYSRWYVSLSYGHALPVSKGANNLYPRRIYKLIYCLDKYK
jgi:hypothetical protein